MIKEKNKEHATQITTEEVKELKLNFTNFKVILASRIESNDYVTVNETLDFILKAYERIVNNSDNEVLKILLDESLKDKPNNSILFNSDTLQIDFSSEISTPPLQKSNPDPPIIELYNEPNYVLIKISEILISVLELSARKSNISTPNNVLDIIWNLLMLTLKSNLKKETKNKLTNNIFPLYEKIFLSGIVIEKFDERNDYHSYIDSAAFVWYSDLLFHSTFTYSDITSISAENIYLKGLANFCSKANDAHFDQFVYFVNNVGNNRNNIIDDFRVSSLLDKKRYHSDEQVQIIINRLEDKFRNLKYQSTNNFTLLELNDWMYEYNIVISDLVNYIDDEDKEIYHTINENNKKSAENNFLSNNYKLTILYFVIYLLQQKEYNKVKKNTKTKHEH